MSGQEKVTFKKTSDCLIEVTAWAGLTVNGSISQEENISDFNENLLHPQQLMALSVQTYPL